MLQYLRLKGYDLSLSLSLLLSLSLSLLSPMVLRINPRVSCILGKPSITEIFFQP
jgi:hypothetical protein